MTGVSIFINIIACALAFALRRDLLNPLFGFSFIWGTSLFLLFISSNNFYPINIETEFVFIMGSIGFIVGYLCAEFFFQKLNSIAYVERISATYIKRKYLWTTLFILLIGWFDYYREISSLTSGSGLFFIFQEARYALVQASLAGEKLLGPVANLEVIAIYFAMLCVVERDNGKYGRLLAYCSLVVASFYVVLGGAKGGLTTIAMVVFFLYSFNMRWRVIARRGALAFIIVIALFCLGLIMVNFTYNEFAGTSEMLNALYISVRNYWIGGILAFDQVVSNPTAFEKFQSISRFFLETANSLGASFYVPSVHADYVNISDTENTNVFTIYYSYYLDGGLPAVFFLSLIYSFVVGFVYLKAKFGDKRYLLMYSLLLSGLVFSIVSERFFLGLNGLIKALIFWWGFYFVFSVKPNYLPQNNMA